MKKRSRAKVSVRKRMPSLKKLSLILIAVMAVFIMINLDVLTVYAAKTYPNTRLNSQSVGSLPISKLNNLISSPEFFPAKLTMTAGVKSYTMSPSALGVSENKQSTIGLLKKHSWLPIINLFSTHNAVVVLNINKTILNSQMASLASSSNVAPVGAKISIVNNQFMLTSANNGMALNIKAAAEAIIAGVRNNKPNFKLPTEPVAPNITNASLVSELNSLTSQTKTAITLSYNGQTTTPSPNTITNWYVASANSYTLSYAKIYSYLKNLGIANGISVSNLPALVSSIESALAKETPLKASLLAAANVSCSTNSLSQLIIVSISSRHLWACNGSTTAYDSAVVTGDLQHLDTLTPIGTYHIYAKETNKTLTGSDENGTWNDFVNYWMPFLYNRYGAYGFHDATWRDPSAFGNIDPNSANASNGCVELPLATAQWLYNWASVGTTVNIVN